jgi:WD40 repeat protein
VLDSSSPTLAVGGQLRNVQIYDLRVSGQTAPPITFFAHNFGVHGIQTDPHRPNVFATFCSVHKEPVKIWDARRLDSDLCEIKVGSVYSTMDDGSTPTGVSAIQWSTLQPGSLSIAVGNTIYDYDTSTSTRPIHKDTVYARAPISDFCLYRQQQPKIDYKNDDELLSVLYPRRTLVVHSDRSIHDMAMHRLAPLALSGRDGRVVHGLGRMLWVGPTTQGPSAMESLEISADEDISATMLRRYVTKHSFHESSTRHYSFFL